MPTIKVHRIASDWGSASLADRINADVAGLALPGAACTQVDPEVFFPHEGDELGIDTARDVCSGCPVRARCFELFGNLPYGVVAGLTPSERRALRRVAGDGLAVAP